jgi:hypothetical protein
MGWDQATNNDVISRLADPNWKGGVVNPNPAQNAAYAPNAPVRPVSQIQGTPMAAKPQDMSLPAWGGEQGYGAQFNPSQAAFIGANAGGNSNMQPVAQPFQANNWSQAHTSNTTNAPAWADQVLNQSAYNTLPKNTPNAPTYAQGWNGFNRNGDNRITFRTQDVGNQWSRNSGYQIPANRRGQDWFGNVNTSMANWWNDPRAISYEYHPQSAQMGLGQFLLGNVAPMVAGGLFGLTPNPGSTIFGGMTDR